MIERFRRGSGKLVLSKLSGSITDDQLIKHVSAFTKEPEETYGILELADCREVTNVDKLTVKGCVDAGLLERNCRRSQHRKLAILVACPNSQFMSG